MCFYWNEFKCLKCFVWEWNKELWFVGIRGIVWLFEWFFMVWWRWVDRFWYVFIYIFGSFSFVVFVEWNYWYFEVIWLFLCWLFWVVVCFVCVNCVCVNFFWILLEWGRYIYDYCEFGVWEWRWFMIVCSYIMMWCLWVEDEWMYMSN